MEQYDLIIIGAGPAGMAAAIYGARADLNVLMLDKLAPGGQIINTNMIENYPGIDSINGATLGYNMYLHTQNLNVAFDYRTVVKIEDKGNEKIVHCLENEMQYSCKSIIVATGTTPRKTGLASEEKFINKGISWCAICDGAQFKNKDVVVIGGGNSAVEESIYLAGIVKSLTIITMFDLTADLIACDKLRSFKNVTIYPYQDIKEFTGDDVLSGVVFQSTKTGEIKTVACQGVFEYIGLKPTTIFLENLNILNKQGYLQVNDQMETSIKGIYGAGDCIEKEIRQVVTACNDGAIAALNASHYIQKL